jgi:hypothetical protein
LVVEVHRLKNAIIILDSLREFSDGRRNDLEGLPQSHQGTKVHKATAPGFFAP